MDVKIDITNKEIETNRLILRAWKESDLEDFYEYASVPGVGEMAGWQYHKTIEDTKKVLDSFIEGENVYAIVYKDNGKVIGSFGLHESWANDVEAYKNLRVKEIGYVLAKDYWGMRLMPEAVKKVIEYCFSELGLDALTCGHFISNSQSKSVIEKSGFEFVRKSTYYTKDTHQPIEDMLYILLAKK